MSATVREVVRGVVAEVAPHEVQVLDRLSSLDDESVTRLFSRRKRRGEPLGFGIAEVAALVTPVVWLVVDELARRGVEAAVDGTARPARSIWRWLLRRPPELPGTIPPLTPEQLGAVRQRVLERAGEAGLSGPAAEALADAVFYRLSRESVSAPQQSEETID
ncbi:hypothetical protein OOK58_43210 [Streptomyces sp. NBC_01728]|uniref:hypothetical protein n=1 Tax=unclassified Streptomyces TaxID=2593676 RepID=UPI00225492B4|nr:MULTISPECIES: hypothetical protein [unclassified Streptomyces]MCX4458722.1 hypothetical protein [Streptomyces sp. NBC_01719]MCX4498079.1 hypothetical protein [Streptomyces sp. NBC_01728]